VLGDSHAHLTLEHFDPDREEVIARARQSGVARIVTVSSFIGDASACAALAARHDFIHFTAGVHPHEAKSFTPEAAADIRTAATRPKAVAIGEIGLDYHYDFSPRDVQQAVFRAQMRLARERRQPVVIHTREADEDTIAILREEGGGEVRGVLHCFTGGRALAEAALALGFFVSVAGIITFPRAEALRETVRAVPLDRLLTETDSPFLAPVPHRGKRNEPAHVARVVAALGDMHGMPAAAVAARTAANFHTLFRP
jgi:TatD DNase family protein